MSEPRLDVRRKIFQAAPFINRLGIELDSVSAGECRATLALRPAHFQQNGVVHSGVIATLADHTAGGAAGSGLDSNTHPLTVEFKVNLLRPASGDHLACHARVLKAGRTLIVAESEVFADHHGNQVLVAKAMVTLMVVKNESRGRTGRA